MYDWLEQNLLPPLVALVNYNGAEYFLEDQYFTEELTDYRVMPLQIRQHRVEQSKSGIHVQEDFETQTRQK